MKAALAPPREQGGQSRRLLLFGVSRLDELLARGNVWYVRHYESWFDEVDVVYLYGYWPESIQQGRTRLISLGDKGRFWRNILAAPFRLYRHARRVGPTHYLTADIAFSWWTGLLLRWLGGARIVLMPVCIPDEIYNSTGRSLSGLPICVEKLFLRLSYAAAGKIIMSRNGEASVAWLRGDWQTSRKLQVVPVTVEEFPSAEFFAALARMTTVRRSSDEARLLYVGRLHREKLVTGLIDMMHYLKIAGVCARLRIAGDGPERAEMEFRAKDLDVADRINWLGSLPNVALVEEYALADVFVSTVTGTALREAGLCCVPIVGYEADWVKQLLRHEETALLVPTGDAAGLAREVARVLADHGLRRRLASNFHAIAKARWSPENIREALRFTFEERNGQ